jgi:hypothetical protein
MPLPGPKPIIFCCRIYNVAKLDFIYFTLAARCISEKLSGRIAGTCKPAAFDPHCRHEQPVARRFFAVRRLTQLTVLGTKQMAVRKQLFLAPISDHDVASEPDASRTIKKDTQL